MGKVRYSENVFMGDCVSKEFIKELV